MPTPTDAIEVNNALRFGWYMAEVRGRNWPQGPRPAGDLLPDRGVHDLPLRVERSATELRIEAQAVLGQLAGALCVDTGKDQQNLTGVIDQQGHALARALSEDSAVSAAWKAFADSLFRLDAHAQDTLTARSESQAAAYQLGRGLAEVYRALAPCTDCIKVTPNCWAFRLGEHRCQELTRLVGRLSRYFDPYCPPAIANTLRLWQTIDSDPAWRAKAQAQLYEQLRRWHELLIIGQDPSTLIRPYALCKNWRASLHALRAVWIQLVTPALSLASVITAITLIANGSSTAFVKALLGALGAVGLSAATVQARLKNIAQSLLKRLRQDAYTDLVSVAIAVEPDKPGVRKPRKVVTSEVRKRTLTTVAEASVP
jgi:hypothetical protein